MEIFLFTFDLLKDNVIYKLLFDFDVRTVFKIGFPGSKKAKYSLLNNNFVNEQMTPIPGAFVPWG